MLVFPGEPTYVQPWLLRGRACCHHICDNLTLRGDGSRGGEATAEIHSSPPRFAGIPDLPRTRSQRTAYGSNRGIGRCEVRALARLACG